MRTFGATAVLWLVVAAIFFGFIPGLRSDRVKAKPPPALVQPLVRSAAPPHGGCVLAERFGPGVKVCRDGTFWHGKVDGPEFMGDLDEATLPPILVPAASG